MYYEWTRENSLNPPPPSVCPSRRCSPLRSSPSSHPTSESTSGRRTPSSGGPLVAIVATRGLPRVCRRPVVCVCDVNRERLKLAGYYPGPPPPPLQCRPMLSDYHDGTKDGDNNMLLY
ncbi:Uncharacterized protein FWK35_00030964 [Aphis craccivora]|uniref:Uncharacterized protein n=1 Tax=Aphis craccivora TaxID=307492 RepID=A0A6G0YAI1_APHCR|nr:Uncharacterized protein FWK35_00030964 [Aphis craccivora]